MKYTLHPLVLPSNGQSLQVVSGDRKQGIYNPSHEAKWNWCFCGAPLPMEGNTDEARLPGECGQFNEVRVM